MFAGWSIKKQLLTAFAIVVALVAVLAANGARTAGALYDRISVIVDANAAAMEAAARLEFLAMRLSASADMVVVAAYRGDVAGVEAEWKALEAAYQELGPTADALAARTTVAENRTRARDVVAAMRQWHGCAEQAVNHARTRRLAEADAAMQESEKYSDEIAEALVTTIFQAEVEDLQVARREAAASKRSSDIVFALLLGLVAATGLVLWIVLQRIDRQLRGVAQGLRRGADEVAAASGQVASSSQHLSQGATEQAASLEETSAAMEEVASMTRRNVEDATNASNRMAEAEGFLATANQALTDLVASMAGIQESSSQVTKIVRTIDEIAFQTNILALNAAVEAARAGETGLGFAVVAEEVRNLAQRSAQAARDTAVLIEASANKAAAGGSKVEAVVGVMASMTESSRQVKALVDEVTAASRQQTQGIEQVSQAVTHMERVTQTTAATAEETAAASEELHAQADQSMARVRELEALVGSSEVGHTVPSSGPAALTGDVVQRTDVQARKAA